MFTGIIQEIGTVARIERTKGLVRLTIHAPRTASRVQRLESVAVNGTCLSVVSVRGAALIFEVIRETQTRTALGGFRAAQRVNLEPSLAVTDRLNGHILFGHIDGVGTIIRRRQLPSELVLEIRMSRALRAFLVPKGPMAIDGVSLTAGKALGATTCSVHLIPETLRQTTLGTRVVGDRVNLELDYLAKLVRQFLKTR